MGRGRRIAPHNGPSLLLRHFGVDPTLRCLPSRARRPRAAFYKRLPLTGGGSPGAGSAGPFPCACPCWPAAFYEAAYPVKPGTEPGSLFCPSSSRARSRCRSAFYTRSSVTRDHLVGAMGDPRAVALTKRRPHQRP